MTSLPNIVSVIGLSKRYNDNCNKFSSTSSGASGSSSTRMFAINQITFDVRAGERLAIIGRNGSGKSTLLKILTRIIPPSQGEIRVKGRILSLLDVAAGFHSDLNGLENIFLRGVLLGMSRKDIVKVQDDIINFSEINSDIYSPVKFYSDGMRLKLAFSIAAHLDAELFVVDEVLSVGDWFFQQKCISYFLAKKFSDKAIIFTSHDLNFTQQIATRALVLKDGKVVFDGSPIEAVRELLDVQPPACKYAGGSLVRTRIVSTSVQTSTGTYVHKWGEKIVFVFTINIVSVLPGLSFSFYIHNSKGKKICQFWLFDNELDFGRKPGSKTYTCTIPSLRCFQGNYYVSAWLTDYDTNCIIENLESCCIFGVSMSDFIRPRYAWEDESCQYIEDFSWRAED
jgi:lipopolysaccharide transport system ATP-binding protein